MLTLAIPFVFILCMMFAILSDITSMTIPNRLCLALAGAFFVVAPLSGADAATLGLHLGVGFAVLLVTMGMFAQGWMGGGDAKLLAATALWFGPTPDLLNYLLVASIFGAGLTIALLSARANVHATGFATIDRHLNPKEGIPYGVALGAAAIWVFLEGGWMTAAS